MRRRTVRTLRGQRSQTRSCQRGQPLPHGSGACVLRSTPHECCHERSAPRETEVAVGVVRMSMDLPLSLTVPDRRSAEVPAIWLRIHETAKRVARWMAAFVHLERGDLPVRSHLFGREPISTSDGVRDRAIDVLRDHHERVLAHPRRIWAAAHSFTVLRRLLTSVNKPSTTPHTAVRTRHSATAPTMRRGPAVSITLMLAKSAAFKSPPPSRSFR